MARNRIHADNAARQKAYFAKKRLLNEQLKELLGALCDAAEAGRSAKLTNNLPDDINEWVPELTRRLQGRRLIVCNAERKSSDTSAAAAA